MTVSAIATLIPNGPTTSSELSRGSTCRTIRYRMFSQPGGLWAKRPKKPAPMPHPANLNHGEQKGGGQSEQKHSVQRLQYPGVVIALPAI